MRRQLLLGFEGDSIEEQNANQRKYVVDIAHNIFDNLIDQYMPKEVRPEEWDFTGLKEQLRALFGFDAEKEVFRMEEMEIHEIREQVWQAIENKYAEKEVILGAEALRGLERYIML